MAFPGKKILAKVRETDLFESLKHSATYFSANVATQAVAFISIPIFTRILSEAEYGIIEVFKSYMFIGATIFSLNSFASVSRYYFEKNDDFPKFIGSTLTLVLVTFLFSSTILFIFKDSLAELMQLPGDLIFYLILASFFTVILRIFQQVVVPQKRSKDELKVSILRAVTLLALSVILITSLETDKYLGQIWAVLIVGFIISVYIFYLIKDDLRLSFDIKHFKYILNYSVPLLPYHISALILAQFSRLMINSSSGSAEAGLFSFAFNIGMILSVVNISTNKAILPDFFDFLDKGEFKRLDQLIRKMFSVVLFAALGLVLFAKEIVTIMADEKFHVALSIVPIIVTAYVFDAIFIIYSRYVIHSKKTYFLSVSLIIAGVVNVLLNLYYIPEFGYQAGAYATFFSYVALAAIVWFITKVILKYRVTPLKILTKPLIAFAIFSGIFYLSGIYVESSVLLFVIKLILISSFIPLVLKNEMKKLMK